MLHSFHIHPMCNSDVTGVAACAVRIAFNFHSALLHVSAVYISHHQVGIGLVRFIFHYIFMFNPIHGIITKKFLIQSSMLLFGFSELCLSLFRQISR